MNATTDARVDALRAFSRSYTRVLRVLDEGLLETPYSLTEARILYELAHLDVMDAVALRRELGLDAGYLSRIVRRFEVDGLVIQRRSPVDARRQVLQMTPHGRDVFAVLDARSAEQARALLSALDDDSQRRLVAAMATVRRALEPSSTAPVALRAPGPGDFGWVVARHGAIYAYEFGWDATFEALVARIVADYVDQHDAAREAAWIATIDGDNAGCVFCVHKDNATAQLRLLLVEPDARGSGIGSLLVDACIDFARRAGYRRITLWTNDVLVAARRIYEAAGFRLIDEVPHASFGVDLVGQNWQLEL
jgi:DNA-binding MarR family transcriptional regulator/GNAT superfamily N-acetyltransferase